MLVTEYFYEIRIWDAQSRPPGFGRSDGDDAAREALEVYSELLAQLDEAALPVAVFALEA